MLKKGKTYTLLSGSGYFPFSEKKGIYRGRSAGGFLKFDLSNGKAALMNGGNYAITSKIN